MSQAELITLAEELLDALLDTVELTGEPALDLHWRAHMEYLSALQRRGQELLAAHDTAPAGR